MGLLWFVGFFLGGATMSFFGISKMLLESTSGIKVGGVARSYKSESVKRLG